MRITKNNPPIQSRPFLKWPGGKYRLIERIQTVLPKGKKLIEPFVGGGAVFLNMEYEQYLLNDANRDLITLYQMVQTEGKVFIEYCRSFFTKRHNNEKKYYQLRKQFNAAKDPILRSALFLYLNRHGYNGLCRYNAGKGEFNVPFGRYIAPYFPEQEMLAFYEKAKRAVFTCEDFTQTLKRATKRSVVYCDPPYVPLSETAYFTDYYAGGFTLEKQRILANAARELAKKGIPVLLSNHSTAMTQALYKQAEITEFVVSRYISCKATARKPVLELLAYYPIHV